MVGCFKAQKLRQYADKIGAYVKQTGCRPGGNDSRCYSRSYRPRRLYIEIRAADQAHQARCGKCTGLKVNEEVITGAAGRIGWYYTAERVAPSSGHHGTNDRII